MVKSLLFCLLLIVNLCVIAQVPAAFNYQAVVRNNSGEIIGNQNVTFKISILQNSANGTATYVETHSYSTNNFGLVNLKIGKGTLLSGNFNPANWGSTDHFMKVEFDVDGGTSYAHLGTTQLLAVPYAFHAQTVENDEVNDADADARNEIQTMSLSGTQLSLSDGGGSVTLPSSGGGDNWGTDDVKSDATLNGAGTVTSPLSVNGDLTDDQTLSISGSELTISEGNTVTLPNGGNIWQTENSNLYYNTGKVGIGEEVGTNRRQFQVTANDDQAISGENSSTYPTLFLRNNGSGPAADFRNALRISDGTEGEGKVLTSAHDGLTSWQTPAKGVWTVDGVKMYSDNIIGLGTTHPLHILDIQKTEASIRIKGTSDAYRNGNAYIVLDKKDASRSAYIIHRSNDDNKFYSGLFGSNNYSISTSPNSLNGLSVEETTGNVTLSDNLIVIGKMKMAGGNPETGKVLTSDATGNASWETPVASKIKYTMLPVDCASLASFTNNYAELVNFGTFSKVNASSKIELTFQGRVLALSTSGGGVLFELRVDGKACTEGKAIAVLRSQQVGNVDTHVTFTGIFSGINTGDHSASIWVKASSGTGTTAMVDPGCFHEGQVIVKEVQ